MKTIEITQNVKVEIFDSNDYIENQQKVYSSLKDIFNSQSSAIIRDFVDDLNSDIFLQNKKVFIYVLKVGDDVVCFAIFSKISNRTANFDCICTHRDFEKLGFATVLVRAGLVNLKQNEISNIVANFEEQNFAYQNLLFSFSKIENMATKEEENRYKFDISNVDENKILQDVKNLII